MFCSMMNNWLDYSIKTGIPIELRPADQAERERKRFRIYSLTEA